MEHEIRETTAALADALSRGDAAGAAAWYVDDAKLLAPKAELVAGRGEIESYWRTGIALGVSRVNLETLDIGLAGAVAVEIGHYAILVASGRNDPIVDRGKYLALHKQLADGVWRRAVEVFNPDGQN